MIMLISQLITCRINMIMVGPRMPPGQTGRNGQARGRCAGTEPINPARFSGWLREPGARRAIPMARRGSGQETLYGVRATVAPSSVSSRWYPGAPGNRTKSPDIRL